MLNYLELPFDVKRIYWLSGPSGLRGQHAHKSLRQVMICFAGEARLKFDNGSESTLIVLRAGEGIEVPSGLWRSVAPLAIGDRLLVLASDHFNESDYLRDYGSFVRWKSGEHTVL